MGCVQYTVATLIFIIVIIFWSPRDGVLRKEDGSGCSSQSYYLPLKFTWIFSGLSRQSPVYTKPDLCPHILSLLDLTSVVHKQGSPSKAYRAFKNKSLSLTFRYRAVGLKVWAWDQKHQHRQPYTRPAELEIQCRAQQSVLTALQVILMHAQVDTT